MTKRELVYFFIGVFALMGICILIEVFILGRDISPPADGDLRITRLLIPEKENAYYYFNRAAAALNPSYQENLKPSSSPKGHDGESQLKKISKELGALVEKDEGKSERVAQLVNGNKALFEDMERGLACRDFQFPEVKNLFDPFPFNNPLRNIGRLNSIRASYFFKIGKEKEALDEAMKTIQFGHQIEGSPGTLIHFLVGGGIKKLGLDRFGQLVQKTTLPEEILKPYLLELDHYRVNRRGWRTAFKQEYRLICKLVDDLVEGKLPEGKAGQDIPPAPFDLKNPHPPHLFLVNHTKMLLAETCRTAMENESRTYADRKPFFSL